MVEAISAIGGEAIAPKPLEGAAPVPSFFDRMRAEATDVNARLVNAENELQKLASGEQTNIHHVMLAVEDARLQFQLVAQVRNKVMEAYQDLMRMQI